MVPCALDSVEKVNFHLEIKDFRVMIHLPEAVQMVDNKNTLHSVFLHETNFILSQITQVKRNIKYVKSS